MTLSVLSCFTWVYRGEGNANLVLSLPENRLIVRIHKTDGPKSLYEKTLDFLKNWFSWEDIYNVVNNQQDTNKNKTKKYNVFDHIVGWMMKLLKSKYRNIIYNEVRDLRFYRDVIKKIIGSNYACDCASIYITKKEAKEIENIIADSRPDHRKNKRLCYGRATLFEDFALLPLELQAEMDFESPTFSIEIKPKQGWYPECERSDSKCQFCLKQYLKIERGQIDSFTSYCPLDLYSGDKKRMLKALHALVENPQNNFKVFLDGQMVYGENFQRNDFYKYFSDIFSQDSTQSESEICEEFCQFLQTVLTRRFSKGCDKSCELRECICNIKIDNSKNMESIYDESDNSCQYLNSKSKLPRGCVLERIYSMQKLNDKGLNYYSEIYKGRDVDEEIYTSYIDELLEQVSTNQCPGCLVENGLTKKNQTDLKISQYKDEMNLLKYLLFAIARDCSLMITFRKIVGEIREYKDCIVKTNVGAFAVNVGVIDLSPKPLSTITKAICRNTKIAKAYKRSLSNTASK